MKTFEFAIKIIMIFVLILLVNTCRQKQMFDAEVQRCYDDGRITLVKPGMFMCSPEQGDYVFK